MKFEILLSTMFRTDLRFLDNIFKNNNIEDLNVLIINQTSPDKLLKSTFSNIRVINSYERGVSQSKNLAFNNAKGEICLLADDDVVYKPNLKSTILKEFNLFKDAYLLNFETVSEKGILHSNYPKRGLIQKKDFSSIHMTGMAVRIKLILENDVFFNEYFSYGGKFGNGDEVIFLREAHSKNLKAFSTGIILIEHPEESSGKEMASDINIHAYAARINHFHGTLISYASLIKYIRFLYAKKLITFDLIYSKFKIGIKGIKEYNNLIRKGLIKRQR